MRKTAPRTSSSCPGPQDFTSPRQESSFLEGDGARVVNLVLKPSSMLNPNCLSPHWACFSWEPAGKFGVSGGAGLLVGGQDVRLGLALGQRKSGWAPSGHSGGWPGEMGVLV